MSRRGNFVLLTLISLPIKPHQQAGSCRTIRCRLMHFGSYFLPGAQDGLLLSKKGNETVTPENETFEITRAIPPGGNRPAL
jgi:hypothetical protein